jgi:hypothetical protein
MVSRMTTSYGPQTAQVNEKPPQESFLDLTLTQHPCDEHPELREVCPCLEVQPFQVWYYRNSPNFYTLVILLQINFTFDDEPETVCEGFYETKNILIFAWFSIHGIKHYCWLRSPIC